MKTTYSGRAQLVTPGGSIAGEAYVWARSWEPLPTWGGRFTATDQRGLWVMQPGEYQLVLPDGRGGPIRPEHSLLEMPRLFELSFAFHGLGPPPID